MKRHILLKTLAVLLCAASLLGIVGGAAGVLTLVEQDLYNKTVDEVIDQQIQLLSAEAANQIGSRYADLILGGCPEEIARYSVYSKLPRNFTTYGYSIVNSDGKVVESLNPELKHSTQTHVIPITGQYMHLVSMETASQAMEAEARKHLESYSNALTDIDGNRVPEEGLFLDHVFFTDQDGHVIYEALTDGLTGSSTYYYRDYLLENGAVDSFTNSYDHMGGHTGFLFYNVAGQLAYTSVLEEQENVINTTVYGVLFRNGSRDFTFQTEDPDGLGMLTNKSGHLSFTSFAAKQEPVPAETVVETIPATTAETLPAETTLPTESTEEAEATETTAETTEATEVHEEDATEESAEETSETEDTPSSASADPESDSNSPKEPATKYLDRQDIDWDQFDIDAEERILYDWLLAHNLIADQKLPDDLLSDKELHYWLVEYKLIDADQTIPQAAPAPEETVPEETVPEEIPEEEDLPEATEPVMINGKPLETYQINRTEYVNRATGEPTTAKYIYLPMPELTVEIYAGPEAMKDISSYEVLRILHQYRGALLPVIGICLLLFILSAVYLYTAAGRKPDSEEIRAGGLNRLPLDLYLVLGTAAIAGILALGIGTPTLLNSDLILGCSFAISLVYSCCLIFTGFWFAVAAQAKTGRGFWWRNTLVIRFLALLNGWAVKFRHWMEQTGCSRLLQSARRIWQAVRAGLLRICRIIRQFASRIGAKLNWFFSLIPLTWQWVLAGSLMIILIFATDGSFLSLILCLCLILYGSHCFGILLATAKKMGKGDLENKINSKIMVGSFQDFANDLNSLADVAKVTAQKQLKSERMKTELITNVSHDIKTPLTSIINYVDLLQKPHSEEEGEQYLEVLDRQSQRLKKLVDDLMDMSKASTGNMDVEITRVDAVESVNQALGEFADKLERAQLYPVFRHSENSVPIMADGKLVWRVLSNLLSNTVKYALPGTRIYLDLTHVNRKVIISLKNISRKELNIDAEELMERFVRGDISRNTDGSGLGLNIAKSLMELQNGQLQILVDGDLFKVTLIFPDAD